VVHRHAGSAGPEFVSKDGAKLDYIPGLGVEQWELRPHLLVPATELERVAPGTKFTKWI